MSGSDADAAELHLRHRAKQALRAQIRKVRGALPAAACDARSARITEQALGLPEVHDAQTVLAFASIRNEVRTAALLVELRALGKRVVLPRVDEEALVLHAVDGDTSLVEGAFSVPEPPASAPVVKPGEIDLAFCPALCVDPRGYRIGYGGGYYDRLLPTLDRATTCALAYDFQLVAEVPELSFDHPVDLVVTDARVIRSR